MGEEDKKPDNEPEPDTAPASIDMIDQANEAAERLERANNRREELLQREEKLAIQKTLGGKAEAGIEPEKPKEETAEEYKNRIMKGG